MANPNDIIRDAILRHLYELHHKARGISSVGTGIRDVWSATKNLSYGKNSHDLQVVTQEKRKNTGFSQRHLGLKPNGFFEILFHELKLVAISTNFTELS